MVLITEQERLIANEQQLINNSTSYVIPGSYGTIHDYGNITLAQAGLVAIVFNLSCSGGTMGLTGFRLKVGGTPIFTANYSGGTNYPNGPYGCLIYLAAGTYDILLEGAINGNSGNVTSMKVGLLSFNDLVGSALAAYSSGIALTVANRITPAGPLLKATYCVQVYAVTASANTNLENVGDNLTNGVSISVDGAQVNWSEKYSPDDSGYHGVSGKVFLPYSVGSSHTVTITKRNSNTTVNVTVVACPWILASSNFSPVNLNFAQGSTVYCVENPLFVDATKFIGVGTPRGVSFGTATDYYNSTSASGLLVYSYQIDVADVTQVDIVTNGMGACIEIIGVDAR
jgi:hypothetical protein